MHTIFAWRKLSNKKIPKKVWNTNNLLIDWNFFLFFAFISNKKNFISNIFMFPSRATFGWFNYFSLWYQICMIIQLLFILFSFFFVSSIKIIHVPFHFNHDLTSVRVKKLVKFKLKIYARIASSDASWENSCNTQNIH